MTAGSDPPSALDDDAGAGRRGARPRLTPALVARAERAYGIEVRSATDLGGSVNLNVRVETAAESLVLRAYRRHAGLERVGAIQQARGAMAAAGLPAARPRATLDGRTCTELGETIVELEPFVPSDGKMDAFARVRAALPTLGAVHDVLRPLDLGASADRVEFANHVPPTDLVERVVRGTDRIRRWEPSEDERAIAGAADRLAEQAAAAQATVQPRLPPPQLTHGDFWDDNVLFRDGGVVLVADLDFMSRRHRIDDLALILFFTRYVLADPPSPQTLAALLAAYDDGTTTKLSPAERAALPIAMARQPLWSLAVWVASLDDEDTARRHLDGHLEAVRWGSDVLADLDRWQDGFA